jgi:hypothetical protein
MKMTMFEGSPDELAELLERMPQLVPATVGQAAAATATAEKVPATVAVSVNPVFTVWTKEKVEEMWRNIYGDQRKLVSYLISKNGKATISDVNKHLGFERGPQIAGVLSSITRNARRITKYRLARFVDDWFGDKDWGYKLPDNVLGFLREILEREKQKGGK